MKICPEPATKQVTKKILEQINNLFVKINENDNNYNIGIFCHLNYKKKDIPVIIINNHKVEDDIINVTINNKKKLIEFGDTIYKNKEYNFSILEIKENTEDKLHFSEIDDNLLLKEPEMHYNNQSIYSLQFIDEKDICVSYGVINDVNKSQIRYSCNLTNNSKLSFLFNLSNNKLIGFHQNGFNCFNRGIFISFLINEFLKIKRHKNLQNSENEINLSIKVDKSNINKKYFF